MVRHSALRIPRSAFTIVELLVVVTIIVVLLALLTPGLDRAMEAAQRAKCAANLHTFGIAHNQYGMNNKGKLMAQPRHYKWAREISGNPKGLAYGFLVWLHRENGPEFNVESINPYLGQSLGSPIRDPWLCPSSQMTEFRAQNEILYLQQRGTHPPAGSDDGWYIESEYNYFGGRNINLPPEHMTRPDRITSGKVGGPGFLMVDMAFRHNGDYMWYNHGEYERVPAGTPLMEGFNRLSGDGSAGWDEISARRAKALWNRSPLAELGDYFSSVGTVPNDPAVSDDLINLY